MDREQGLGLLVLVCLACIVLVLVEAGAPKVDLSRRLDAIERRIERGETLIPRLKATAEAMATECAPCR